jgi:hypothetical protein
MKRCAAHGDGTPIAADRRMRLLATCALTTTLFLPGASALACGASPSPVFSIDAVSPSDQQQGVARDAAVEFRLKAWEAHDDLQTVLSVRVTRERDGMEALGALDLTRASDLAVHVEPIALWAPRTLLDANTTYVVELTTSRPRPEEPEPVLSRTTFTTSDTASPELHLVGELRGTLRMGTAPVRSCMGAPCKECPIVGESPALYADLELPRAQGGFAEHGYSSWLTLDDTTARSFTGPGEGESGGERFVHLSHYRHFDAEDELAERSVEIPREDRPYVACFGYNVWDAFGHAREAESLCFSAQEIEAAWNEGSNADAAAGGGCSTTMNVHSPANAYRLGLAILCAVATGRRFRRLAGGAKAIRPAQRTR